MHPDYDLLQRLLAATDYADPRAAAAAEAELRQRARVAFAAAGYVRALADLQDALAAFPPDVALSPQVARFLREV